MFFAKATALLALLASGAFADDVYASFYDKNGNKLASVNYDVSNTNCFNLGGAAAVSFSQGDSVATAKGPYCLVAWSATGCPHYKKGDQQFQNVNIFEETHYGLNSGTSGAASFKWYPHAC